ncbi:hypothetical protein Pmgp_03634 [Pelotomaculum propionicicum]|uniref:Uncharacterized protein n=1 Tax=Pelotomaculum propionicicum TaxID=258475 RepID=A0A4Y7RJ05_9FIRM|nr:hypothetical protein Pmgp_03634 [Pelotomaculum propionicicum]
MDPDLSGLINPAWHKRFKIMKGEIKIAQVICNGHHPQRWRKIPGDNPEP